MYVPIVQFWLRNVWYSIYWGTLLYWGSRNKSIVNILRALPVSLLIRHYVFALFIHKIVETHRNQHAPKFSKGKREWCANGSTDQPHCRMWHLLRTGQNIGQTTWAFDRMDMCAIKVFNQSINQSIRFIKRCQLCPGIWNSWTNKWRTIHSRK
jgi:hypothetical protein